MQPKENNTKISFKNQNQTPKEFGQRTRPDRVNPTPPEFHLEIKCTVSVTFGSSMFGFSLGQVQVWVDFHTIWVKLELRCDST